MTALAILTQETLGVTMCQAAIQIYVSKVTHPIPDPPLFPTPINTLDPIMLNSECRTSIFKNRK